MGGKLLLVAALLTAALGYYMFTPLPGAVQEPWKLMAVDAGFRISMHLASSNHWLGLDHSMTSVSQSLEGLESTRLSDLSQRIERSESGEGVIPQVKVNCITFAGIPVRVYEPPAGGEGNVRRGLIYFHGGGWALSSGKKGSQDAVNRMVSDELNTVAVFVESVVHE